MEPLRAGGGAIKVSALVNAIGVPVDWPQFLTNQPSRTLLGNEQTAYVEDAICSSTLSVSTPPVLPTQSADVKIGF